MIDGCILVETSTLRVSSTRQTSLASKLFAGRTAEQVYQMLPMLYSLCGNAHRFAASNVLNLGAKTQKESRQLVLLELIREYLVSMEMFWISQSQQRRVAREHPVGMGVWSKRLQESQNHPENFIQLVQLIEARIKALVGEPEVWLMPKTRKQWQALIATGSTPVSKAILKMMSTDEKWNKSCQPINKLALAPQPEKVARALLEADDEALEHWSDKPNWHGQAVENSTYSRLSSAMEPLAEAAPFSVRMIARVIDLMHHFNLFKSGSGAGVLSGSLVNEPSQKRVAWVVTARGMLYHYAQLDWSGRVNKYAIIAPTEWNTTQGGLAEKTLKMTAGFSLETQEKVLKAIVDPCVPIKFDFQESVFSA